MKKKLIVIISLLLISFQFNNVFAYDNQLENYEAIINEINETYNTEFQIISEKEYYNDNYNQLFNKDYTEYLNDITETGLHSFKNELIQVIKDSEENIIEVYLDPYTKSTFGTKTVKFFSGHNSMTLRYKYSGSKFDTSFKPEVTVKKITPSMYFQMSSHTGKFINSNKTYSVTARGKVISYDGIINNKSFTVNFNL